MLGALPVTAEWVNGGLTRGNRFSFEAEIPRHGGDYSASGLCVSIATIPDLGCCVEMCSTENSPVESAASSATSLVCGVVVRVAISRMISGMTGPWLQSTADFLDFTRFA